MLLSNCITKLATDETSFGEYILTNYSDIKETVTTKFDSWDDLFYAAALILRTNEYGESLNI